MGVRWQTGTFPQASEMVQHHCTSVYLAQELYWTLGFYDSTL